MGSSAIKKSGRSADGALIDSAVGAILGLDEGVAAGIG
jgi:hypothetical protein